MCEPALGLLAQQLLLWWLSAEHLKPESYLLPLLASEGQSTFVLAML